MDEISQDTTSDERPASKLRRETVWGVLGLGLGLYLLLGSLSGLFLWRGGVADPQEILDANFESFTPPFGLEVQSGALLPGGSRVALLALPGAEQGADAAVLAAAEVASSEDPETTGSGSSEDPDESGDALEHGDQEDSGIEEDDAKTESEFDWSTLLHALPEDSGEAPTRVLLIEYPTELAEQAHGSQFRSLPWVDPAELDDDGGTTTVETERMEWHGLRALYVHTRRFEMHGETHRFRDLIRVCLATGDRYLVLYAFWPPSTTGSLQRTSELIELLQPKTSTEESTDDA